MGQGPSEPPVQRSAKAASASRASSSSAILTFKAATRHRAIGAVSVFKAVYIDKRELKCACVGGASNVPLGFISLTENVMMVAMAVWMLARPMAM
jgi:hypothetical protein